VLDGRGPWRVFRAVLFVRPEAQKTGRENDDAGVCCFRTCEADNKPELESLPTTCSAATAATAGPLNDDLKILSHGARHSGGGSRSPVDSGFLGEAIEGVEHAGLREVLMEAVAAWLKARS